MKNILFVKMTFVSFLLASNGYRLHEMNIKTTVHTRKRKRNQILSALFQSDIKIIEFSFHHRIMCSFKIPLENK